MTGETREYARPDAQINFAKAPRRLVTVTEKYFEAGGRIAMGRKYPLIPLLTRLLNIQIPPAVTLYFIVALAVIGFFALIH
jgi:hypothetical protein